MGICNDSRDRSERSGMNKNFNKENYNNYINNSSNTVNLNNNNFRDKNNIDNNNMFIIKEKVVSHKYIPNELIIKASKGICKITYINQKGTGFFMKADNIKFLVTNSHVVPQELLNKYIEIEMHNKKKKIITLDRNIRYIEFFKEPIDITIIQINDDDVIKNVDFFDYDPRNYIQYKNEKDLDVFASGYPFGDQIVTSSERIISINNFEFEHDIATDVGSSGSPVILLSNSKIIGIHKQANNNYNMGTFIGIIFDKLNKLNDDSRAKAFNFKSNISNNTFPKRNYQNYIIAEIFPTEINIPANIINSHEATKRSESEAYIESCCNEKEIMKCEIEIDNQIIPFSYTYQFSEKRKYIIKYSFQPELTNMCSMFANCKYLTNIDF